MARLPESNLRDEGGHSRLPTFPAQPWAVCVPVSRSLLSYQTETRTMLPPSTQLARWEGWACTQRGSQLEGPWALLSPVPQGCEGQWKGPGVHVPEGPGGPSATSWQHPYLQMGLGGAVRPSSLGTRVSGHGHHSSCFPPLRHRSCCSRELGEVPSIYAGTLPTVPHQRRGPWPAGI